MQRNIRDVHILRQTPVLLIKQILILEIVVAMIQVALFMFSSSEGMNFVTEVGILKIGLHIANILTLVYFLLRWMMTYYKITSDQVIFKKGIFAIKKKMFSMSVLSSISYSQGFWGRVFNYGSIKAESPILSDSMRIYNIPRPGLYARILQEALADLDKQNPGRLLGANVINKG